MVYTGHSLQEILRMPLSKLRIDLAERHQTKKFSLQDLDDFIDSLPKTDRVKQEIPKLREALKTGASPSEPNLNFPETQLLWAAGMIALQLNPDVQKDWKAERRGETLSQTQFWRDIRSTKKVRNEMSGLAWHILDMVGNKQCKFRWGEPGTWFWFNPQQNRINIDLLYTLIAGFDHTRSVIFHEIGHSQLSTAWPPKMEKIRVRMEEIKAHTKTRKLTREEYIELNLLSVEWKLRHGLYNSAEDNTVNRFAVNIGEQGAQDYGPSLNHISAAIAGTGRIAFGQAKAEQDPKAMQQQGQQLTKEQIVELGEKILQGQSTGDEKQDKAIIAKRAEIMHGNFCHAVNMSFFQRNGLFKDNEAGWKLVGVVPQWVTGKHNQTTDEAIKEDIWKELRSKLTGPEGMEDLQPKDEEYLMNATIFRALVNRYCDKRNEIVEELWDKHLDALVKPLLEQVQEQVEEQLDNPQDNNQNDGQDQDGQQQDGDSQPGQGGGGGQGEGGDPIEVEGHGEQPDVDMPPESPNSDGEDAGEDQELDPDADADGAGGAGDDDNEDTLEDLINDGDAGDMDDEGDEADAEAGQEADGQDADGQSQGKAKGQGNGQQAGKGKGKGGQTKGKTLDDLAQGNWENYTQRVTELAFPIAQTRKMLQRIQQKQLEKITRQSKKEHDLIPENGEADRLSNDRHINRGIKAKTGQQVTEDDHEVFSKDETLERPTKVELVILIDGSGSMSSGGGGATNLERALQAAAILYEAGRKEDMDVYIGMWGNDDPPILAKPGDNTKKIGEAFESVRKSRGLNSGTQLAPAINKTVKTLSEVRGKMGQPAGFTHVFVISDGDIQDVEPSRKAIDTLLHNCAQATVDFGIIGERSTSLDKVSEKSKTRRAVQKIGSVKHLDPSKVTFGMVHLVRMKLESRKSFAATTRHNKRARMKKTVRRLDKNKTR